MLYSNLLITTMVISLIFSFGKIESFHLMLFFLSSIPILITTIYGVIKIKNSKLILLTSIYYFITLFCTVHQTITSFYILIPLTLIPILVSRIVKHIGLANRMAFSFWIVLVGAMSSKMLPILKPYILSFDVLLSFFLTSLTIHTNEIETFSANAPVWHSGHGLFSNSGRELFNPERFIFRNKNKNTH